MDCQGGIVYLANCLSAVYKKPLGLFSKSPMTGFYRDGYCRVGPEDSGNHSVAGMFSICRAAQSFFADQSGNRLLIHTDSEQPL